MEIREDAIDDSLEQLGDTENKNHINLNECKLSEENWENEYEEFEHQLNKL